MRPYEVRPGDTDRAVDDCLSLLEDGLHDARPIEPVDAVPPWLSRMARRRWLGETINYLGKLHFHLYSEGHLAGSVNSIVELGGQDAKIVVFKEPSTTIRKRSSTSAARTSN